MVYGKVVLTAISIIAFLGNSLTVLLFIKKSELLKKTYNCLILALAVQDILQAIFIAILPGYILDEDAYTLPTDRTLRWMFCKLFWSQFFIFALGIAPFVPGALMVIAYSRIIVHMKRSEIRIEVIRNNQRMVRKSNALKALKRVTTTAFFASGIIIVCWLPDQLYYALSQVNLTELGTTIHFVFKSLAFANSCINPAIYCFSNRAYRTGLRELFGCFCCKVHPQGGELSGPGEAVHPS
ncbi:somatostatin receptor type 4-like [Dendronephthya gigantea]|uniref:somatostatin receptor type 4-like n=1 Tax=Dendronephthya gigantea TaxID=151771 RepID=UPI0010695632|nr:somatostatin receptor type 4-like [Dendronephthya gigantea]